MSICTKTVVTAVSARPQSGEPQLSQNLDPSGLTLEQFEHRGVSLAPHLLQNFAVE